MYIHTPTPRKTSFQNRRLFYFRLRAPRRRALPEEKRATDSGGRIRPRSFSNLPVNCPRTSRGISINKRRLRSFALLITRSNSDRALILPAFADRETREIPYRRALFFFLALCFFLFFFVSFVFFLGLDNRFKIKCVRNDGRGWERGKDDRACSGTKRKIEYPGGIPNLKIQSKTLQRQAVSVGKCLSVALSSSNAHEGSLFVCRHYRRLYSTFVNLNDWLFYQN